LGIKESGFRIKSGMTNKNKPLQSFALLEDRLFGHLPLKKGEEFLMGVNLFGFG
jgi:hypothetical protein